MFDIYIKDMGNNIKLVMCFTYKQDIDTLVRVNNADKKPPILVILDDWVTRNKRPISLDLNVAAIVNTFTKKDNKIYIEADLLSTSAGQMIKELSDDIYLIGYLSSVEENKYYINDIHIKVKNRRFIDMIMKIFCVLFKYHKCNQVGFVGDVPFGYCKRCHTRCIKNEKGKWIKDEKRKY